MEDQDAPLLYARPSLRHAFFLGFLAAGLVLFGRIKTDLDPRFNPVWLGCFAVFAAFMCFAILKRWTTTYIVTKDEVRSFSGILARSADIVPISTITNARADQSILERILGLVTLQIDCPGGDAPEVVFKKITKTEANEAARLIRLAKTPAASTPPTVASAANL